MVDLSGRAELFYFRLLEINDSGREPNSSPQRSEDEVFDLQRSLVFARGLRRRREVKASSFSRKQAVKRAYLGCGGNIKCDLKDRRAYTYHRAAYGSTSPSKNFLSTRAETCIVKEGFAPDYGIYCSSLMADEHSITFLSFRMYYLARTNDGIYSTTSNIVHGGVEYAVTIDFPEPAYKELLESIPKPVAEGLDRIFKDRKTRALFVDLPYPVEIGIETTLGERIANKDEEYIPFVAQRILKWE